MSRPRFTALCVLRDKPAFAVLRAPCAESLADIARKEEARRKNIPDPAKARH